MKQLERMLTFAGVVDAGSFTAAAERLGCSKAHVSQQISRLEDALGVQLLFRTTRRLELTEAGRTFLSYCRQMQNTADSAHRAVDALRGEMTGVIRITMPASFGEAILRDLVTPFLDRYPGIDFQIELENRVTDLRAGHFDMALRTPSPADEDLVALRLTDYQELLCASPAYLERSEPVQLPESLGTHRLLVNRHSDSGDRVWQLHRGAETVEVPVNRQMVMNHYSLLRRAALAGLGIARLPTYLVHEDLKSGRLERVLPEYDASEPLPVYLVYPWQRTLPLKNRRFIDFTLERFGQAPLPRVSATSRRDLSTV
jgi:DNA-binding transcriptional LysR family regulator